MTLLDVLRLCESYVELPRAARLRVQDLAAGDVPFRANLGTLYEARGWVAEANVLEVDDAGEALQLADSILCSRGGTFAVEVEG